MLDDLSDVSVVQWGVVIGASLAAAIIDIRSRRIPNVITLPLVVTGLLYALVRLGYSGLGDAALGCVFLSLPYVLLFIFAGGGAGDAKMMGAIGAWLGTNAGAIVLVSVVLTGGLLGLLNLAMRKQLLAGFGRIVASFYVTLIALCTGRKGWAMIRADPDQNAEVVDRRLTIPYGPAIFIGVCVGAFVVHLWNG